MWREISNQAHIMTAVKDEPGKSSPPNNPESSTYRTTQDLCPERWPILPPGQLIPTFFQWNMAVSFPTRRLADAGRCSEKKPEQFHLLYQNRRSIHQRQSSGKTEHRPVEILYNSDRLNISKKKRVSGKETPQPGENSRGDSSLHTMAKNKKASGCLLIKRMVLILNNIAEFGRCPRLADLPEKSNSLVKMKNTGRQTTMKSSNKFIAEI